MEDNQRGMGYEESMKCWQEVLTFLSNNDHDQISFKKLITLWQEIQDLRNKQQHQMKNVIQALQEQEEESAHLVSQEEKASLVRTEEVAVQTEIKRAKNNLDNVKQELEEVKQKVNKSRKEEDQMVQELERVKTETTKSIPNARYNVNLYSNITNIRWQFDCEPDEINGFVCNKGDVKPFSLNSKQVSKFFIANYLWDLIEEDW